MQFDLNSKIAVLGGTGHLGSALIHYLVQMGVTPENINIFYLKNTPTNSLHDIEGLRYIPGNILEKETIETAIEDVDYVFHMIGNTSFDPAQKRLQWLVNVEGTRNILELLQDHSHIKRLCYTGTVNTLGLPTPPGNFGTEESNSYASKPSLISFSTPEETLNFAEFVHTHPEKKWHKKIGIGYFESKLAAQELINHYFARYDLNIVSCLPGTMFGSYDYLIGNGMYLVSLYNNKMPAVLPGGLPLAHVMDVARGHVLALEKGKAGERYILSGKPQDNKTLKEMTHEIIGILREKEPDKKFKVPSREIRPKLALIGAVFSELYATLFKKPCILSKASVRAGSQTSWYSSEKAKAELGYTPKHTFAEAIDEMYEYFKAHKLFDVSGRFVDRKSSE